MKNVNFKKKTRTLGPNDVSGIVWACYPLVPQALCLWALVGLRLACIGHRWPSVAVSGLRLACGGQNGWFGCGGCQNGWLGC
jgi:hypothetical protein